MQRPIEEGGRERERERERGRERERERERREGGREGERAVVYPRYPLEAIHTLYLSKQKKAYIEQVELCTKLIPDIDVLLLIS